MAAGNPKLGLYHIILSDLTVLQIQAGKVGRAMWHEEQDWEKKKDQHERHESRNQSIIEGVMQSLIVAYIVVQNTQLT